MPEYDVEALRARFPALAIEQGGRPVALFDGPGGTQVPDSVIAAVAGYYRTSNANHDGPFLTSQPQRRDRRGRPRRARRPAQRRRSRGDQVRRQHDHAHDARRAVGGGVPAAGRRDRGHDAGPRGQRGAVAQRGGRPGSGRAHGRHPHRTTSPWTSRRSTRSSTAARSSSRSAGRRTPSGTINPVAELVRRAHEAGALTYVDAVHAAPHLPIDVQAIGTDFLACSVYKFFGPHVGVLYGRRGRPRRAAQLQAAPRVRPVRDGHPQLRGDRRVARRRRVHRGAGARPWRRVRRPVPGHDRATPRRAPRHGRDPRLRDAPVRAPARRPRGDPGRPHLGHHRSRPLRGAHADGRRDVHRDHARGGLRRAGRAGHRDLVGQLLCRRASSSAWASSRVACSGSASATTTPAAEVDRLLGELRAITARGDVRRACRPGRAGAAAALALTIL